jgi:aliphatic nitrilase
MKVIKAAAVQLSPVLYSREGTIEKVVRQIHELGQEGVQFATFPERWCPATRTSRSSRPRTR